MSTGCACGRPTRRRSATFRGTSIPLLFPALKKSREPNGPELEMKTQCSALRHLVILLAAVLPLVPVTAWATPAYNWDLQAYYPHAEPLPASLTSQQLASITQFDGFYPTTMIAPNGTGLTTAEMDEV